MKTLADFLTELGEIVTDRVLGMNVLCSLSDRFSSLRLLLKCQRPFPSFIEICPELLLEELTTAPTSLAAPPMVLAATTAVAPSALVAGHSTPPHAGSSGSSKNRHRRNHGGRSGSATPSAGGGASASGPRPSALGTGGAAWPTMYNPWTRTLQMWPGPVQGSRATGSSRQAGSQTAFVVAAPGLWPSPLSSLVGWPTTGAPEPVPQMLPAGGPPAPPTLAPLPLQAVGVVLGPGTKMLWRVLSALCLSLLQLLTVIGTWTQVPHPTWPPTLVFSHFPTHPHLPIHPLLLLAMALHYP
jgi:hypothetical protein